MATSGKILLSSSLCQKLSQFARQIHMHPALLSSFRSSREVQELDKYPDVEVLTNPPEWRFVERLLPAETVPQPAEKSKYPSGWQPQKENGSELGYYVGRTKNHMVPVYLHTKFRGQRRITVVRRVQGDIWSLEKDLRAVVEKSRNGKLCATRINELSGQIHFHGDHVDLLRDYLKEKGF
ncbi:probable 39S ribosomal protein L49, mitochondrial [Drosophila eugracilis]|uniref:probable 39S ribosomal protein L49, mitochondrial n=1 Tax=Drosophila eugracilis TaxID=29029 RepID=UPI0007E69A06|nr:probable 39S ribosomal protein L49, mitochondrial [Drosophila eugracilis]